MINILPKGFFLLFLPLPFGAIQRVLVISHSFQGAGGNGEEGSGYGDLRQTQLIELFPVCPVFQMDLWLLGGEADAWAPTPPSPISTPGLSYITL